MGPAAFALPPFEVAVRGGGASARPDAADPGSSRGTSSIRRDRHSAPAARNTWSRPSASACTFTRIEPGTTIIRTDAAMCRPRRMLRRDPQVLDPAVGARAEEHGVDRDLAHRRTGGRSMYSSARSADERAHVIGEVGRVGNPVAQRHPLAGVRAPGDERGQLVGVQEHLGVEHRVVVGDQRTPVRRRRRPSSPPTARARDRGCSRTSSRPARSCRPGRPPRSTCCRPSSGLPSTARGSPSRGTRARNPGRHRSRSWRSPPG